MTVELNWISCESRTTGFIGGYRIGGRIIKMQGDLPYLDNSWVAWGETTPEPVVGNQGAPIFEAHYDNMWLNPGYDSMASRATTITMQYDDHEWNGDNWDFTISQANSQSPIGATFLEDVQEHHLNGIAAFENAQVKYEKGTTPQRVSDGGEYPPNAVTDLDPDPNWWQNVGNRVAESEYVAQYGKQYFDINGNVRLGPNGSKFVVYDLDCITRKSPIFETDDASKTMLGSKQKAWLIAEVIADSPLVDLIVISSTKKWKQTDPIGTTDNWGGYSTERDEIEAAWSTGGVDNLIIIAGDQHRAHVSAGEYPCFVACPSSTEPSPQEFLPNKNDYVYADWSEEVERYGANYGSLEIRPSGFTVKLVRCASGASMYEAEMNYRDNTLNYTQLTVTEDSNMVDIVIGLPPEDYVGDPAPNTTPADSAQKNNADSTALNRAQTVPAGYELYELGFFGRANSATVTDFLVQIGVYTSVAGVPVDLVAGTINTIQPTTAVADDNAAATVTLGSPVAIPAGDYTIVYNTAAASPVDNTKIVNANDANGAEGGQVRDTGLAVSGVLPDPFVNDVSRGVFNNMVWARLREVPVVDGEYLKSNFVGTHVVGTNDVKTILATANNRGQQCFNALAPYGQTTSTPPLSLAQMAQTYVLPDLAAVNAFLVTPGISLRGSEFLIALGKSTGS